jgi:hypothetical protein
MLEPLERRLILGIAAAFLLTLGGFAVWNSHKAHQVSAAVAQADQHHEVATAAAAQGAVYDAQASAQGPALLNDASTVAQLRAEVARLRNAPRPPQDPTLPAPEPVGPVVDLAPLVAEQDRLVEALSRENADLKTQVNTLTLARDSWKGSAQASAAEAVQLRSALAAQQGIAAANLWRGRIQGFAVGLGSGYIAGRLH